ncbi:MAG: ATP synthase F1 subunit gamma [Acidobacteria bacterium]|nr:MAG: ATP synthase F1 subunit gamma [Acidobacteriota bacterium]
MPNLLDIRRRIRSVKNTQQLTKAMKTVAAAKLRRAQERVFSARPYAGQLRNVLGNLTVRIENIAHPLLEIRPEERILLVIVTADRGLCGAFNSNIMRVAQSFMREHSSQALSLAMVGRKGRDFFRRRGFPIRSEFVNIFSRLDYGHAKDISEAIVRAYSNAEVDAAYVVYNEFKSVIQQRVVVEKLLPLSRSELRETEPQRDYIFEQPPQEIFNRLLPRYVEIQIYRALLESAASEHGARMASMDTASRNAGEMIDMLTLNMNRIRQAAITREIIEVVSGAGAS